MISYRDEKIIEMPECSLEELDAKIKALEIKNFGHEIDFEKLEKEQNRK